MSVTNPIPIEKPPQSLAADRRAVLRRVADEYPAALAPIQRLAVERMDHNISLAFGSIAGRSHEQLSIADLGGGLGMFSPGCAALGARRVVLIDDFNDPVNERDAHAALDVHRRHGVEVYSRDVIAAGIADLPGTFDVITSFDSMEHWHHSPKRLFAEIHRKLNPGGAFVLGVPNCVNLRKRITGLFGSNKWSSMQEWYEQPVFRGHVREPDVDDLHYIVRSMGLRNPKIYGRNWLGLTSANPIKRTLTRIIDAPLRWRPTLCADLYLVAWKTAD